MRLSQFPLHTLRETPADADVVSHQLMVRAGMVRSLASGLYSWMPLGLRVLQKVEAVVREEMNRAGAVELLMPAVQPAELWEESGRWSQYGPELLRLTDRHERTFCFGPTHEEVITDLARRELHSYRQLPVNYYQIQTKFRDEIRPRFGVMRAREFLMKDAYSFHMDADSLTQTYEDMHQAYCRVFDRLGLHYRYVLADSGTIGGAVSHEFHVLADSGEDEIVYCENSDYAANIDRAPAPAPESPRPEPEETLHEVDTPDQHTIEDVCKHLGVPPERTLKTLIVHAPNDSLVALFLRGDHRLNATKTAKLHGIDSPLRFASAEEIEEQLGCPTGFLGPVELNLPCYVDAAAAVLSDFVCGANTKGKHYTGANWEHNATLGTVCDLRNVEDGEASPDGKGVMRSARGIEVGHIFQLGDKYSRAMNCSVLDAEGQKQVVTMGCYGIGLTRIVAAAIEQSHDDNGIIWTDAMAPFQLLLCPIGGEQDSAVAEATERLYQQCLERDIDVALDDRALRPGIMFAEADLIGIPHRIVISARGLEDGTLEYRRRDSEDAQHIPQDQVLAFLQEQLTAA